MKTTKVPGPLLTVDQAADRLNVSTRTVGRMYRSAQIPHVRIRGRVLIAEADIDKYIQNHYYADAI